MVQLAYNDTRTGWTDDMITQYERLALDYAIALRSLFGGGCLTTSSLYLILDGHTVCNICPHNTDQSCPISVHLNLHMMEDTRRHSGNDNYWNHGPERKIASWKSPHTNNQNIGVLCAC